MKIAGKCKPTQSGFKRVLNDGFKYAELYLTKNILDNTNVVDKCKNSNLNIVSVHTPHINTNFKSARQYYKQTDAIANELDATLVLHSNPFSTFSLINFYGHEEITSDSFGYENHPDVSSYFIQNYQLDNEYPLILDTAHLHIAEETYIDFISSIVLEYNSNLIPIIHLSDGTRKNDGLDFGDGSVNLEKIINILNNCNYDGCIVLESPIDNQSEALNMINNII